MRKRADEAELPIIGVTVIERLVAESTRPECSVTAGILVRIYRPTLSCPTTAIDPKPKYAY